MTMLSECYRSARKVHICSMCCLEIDKGERYYSHVWADTPFICHSKLHRFCHEVFTSEIEPGLIESWGLVYEVDWREEFLSWKQDFWERHELKRLYRGRVAQAFALATTERK